MKEKTKIDVEKLEVQNPHRNKNDISNVQELNFILVTIFFNKPDWLFFDNFQDSKKLTIQHLL